MRRARILTDNAIAQEEWVEIPLGVDQESSTDIAVDVELDASLGNNFFIRLTRSITLYAPHNLTSGRRIKIMFQQDQIGGRTVTAGPGWTFGGRLTSFHVNTTADGVTIVDAIQTESDIENPVILCYDTTGRTTIDAADLSGTVSTDRYSAYTDLVAESKIGAAPDSVAAGLHASKHAPGAADEIFTQGVAIPDPAGGATVDTEARTAIIAILTYLRARNLIA